ncbi:hypothetical protein AMECASPLE_029067 [Ameca splendens]|uniref:Secreted protein n=1 Tax=Ameca splendens TaxID=208324 RepID=A0ABV0ZTB6_9TELE
MSIYKNTKPILFLSASFFSLCWKGSLCRRNDLMLFIVHAAMKHQLHTECSCISDLTGQVIPLQQLQHQSINCTVTVAMSRSTCILLRFTGSACEGCLDLERMPAAPGLCQM